MLFRSVRCRMLAVFEYRFLMSSESSSQIKSRCCWCGVSQVQVNRSSRITAWSRRVSNWLLQLSWMIAWIGVSVSCTPTLADDGEDAANAVRNSAQTLEQLKAIGRSRSRFLISGATDQAAQGTSKSALAKLPEPKLAEFRAKIAPILKDRCVECHGPDTQIGRAHV